MTTDPRFVDIEHDDFRLKPTRLCSITGPFVTLAHFLRFRSPHTIANNHHGNNEIEGLPMV